jgi:hypothetical protein
VVDPARGSLDDEVWLYESHGFVGSVADDEVGDVLKDGA